MNCRQNILFKTLGTSVIGGLAAYGKTVSTLCPSTAWETDKSRAMPHCRWLVFKPGTHAWEIKQGPSYQIWGYRNGFQEKRRIGTSSQGQNGQLGLYWLILLAWNGIRGQRWYFLHSSYFFLWLIRGRLGTRHEGGSYATPALERQGLQ